MNISIALMKIEPGRTTFWTHWGISELLVTLSDGIKPKYGIGMSYLNGTCWILWAFDIDDIPRVLSHEFLHHLLERLEGFTAAQRLDSISDRVFLGRSIYEAQGRDSG